MSAQPRVTSRCDVAHCGREELHHFLPVLLRGMLPLFSIMTLWSAFIQSKLTGGFVDINSFSAMVIYCTTNYCRMG